jgi:hypothetical protein
MILDLVAVEAAAVAATISSSRSSTATIFFISIKKSNKLTICEVPF